MGIRSRLKRLLKRDKGTRIEDTPPPPRPAPPPKPKPKPKPIVLEKPPEPATKKAEPATKKAEPATKKAEPPADDKVARHFEKARRGVLTFVQGEGGVSTLHAMHSYSERRYFIAHKKFSELMEGLVDEGLITYDPAEGEATLTPAGADYVET